MTSLREMMNEAGSAVTQETHELLEEGRDIAAGLEDGAMPAPERRFNEFKVMAGTAALLVAAVTMEIPPLLLSAPAAITPALEGLREIERHGHERRLLIAAAAQSPKPPEPRRPG